MSMPINKILLSHRHYHSLYICLWLLLNCNSRAQYWQQRSNVVLSSMHIVVSVSVQSFSHVWLFVTPWTTARQASLSITNSRSLLKLMSIESVMPSNHLILCCPLLLLPSIFPSIMVFSNESALSIGWSKYWSFSSTSALPKNTEDWFPLGWTRWISLQSKGLPRVFSNTTLQIHQFFSAQLSL